MSFVLRTTACGRVRSPGMRAPLLLLVLCSLLVACSGTEAPFSGVELAVRGAYSATISPDGRLALLGSLTQGGSLWNLETEERLYNWNHRAGANSDITATAFSPDNEFAMTAESDSLVLWNVRQGSAETFFNAPSEVLSVALGLSGNHALLGLADGTAVLFDARRGGVLRRFDHDGPVRSVAMDASGTRALSGSDDRSARLWDIQSGKLVQRWDHRTGVRLVALSADGALAISVGKYERATLYDTATGLARGELSLYMSRVQRGQSYTAFSFSADGSRLLTASNDRAVQLWQLSSISAVGSWSIPRNNKWKRSGVHILAVGFSPDRSAFHAISADGQLHRLRLAN